MASKQIKVSDLDFNDIKTNIKTFFQGQQEFQDYNFEGSALSVLIDVLAYNTHYNALYQNMTFNEMFLDSAVKRDSIISIARNLGYTPRSFIAAKAKVNLVITNLSSGAPAVFTLERGSVFSTTIDGKSYTFVTTQSYTTTKTTNTYEFNNVEIFQGTQLSNRFTVANNSSFVIPNTGVDLTTLKVSVQNSVSSSELVVYNNVENIVNAMFDSEVYYTKEISSGLYEVYFGQNLIGKQPEQGNVVVLSYISTQGSTVNGATQFTYSGNSIAGGIPTVTTLEASSSGKDPESIESIRINAANSFSAQNRAVSVKDYKTLIYNKIPNVDSVSVWGGEDNIPKQYGKVFISVKPTGRNNISVQEVANISFLLKGKMVTGIVPEFIQTDTYKLAIAALVKYNQELTTQSSDTIKAKILQVLDNYNTENLNKFESVFRYSALSSLIDAADNSILSNLFSIQLSKDFTPDFNLITKRTFFVHNLIKGVTSSSFFFSGIEAAVKIISTGNTLTLVDSLSETFIKNVGLIDKTTFSIDNVVVASANNGIINFRIDLFNNDIASMLNQIITLDLSKTIINIQAETSDNFIQVSN